MIVISVGADQELLRLREWVLTTAGFDVFSTTAPGAARSEFRKRPGSVLLVCHSLAADDAEQLARDFRRTQRHARVIVITNEKLPAKPSYADAFVYGIEGPEALINAIRGSETMGPHSDAA
ncbi:MAG TPA: hypothetical protein VFA89_11880 [Terriglobales bacterium]|nr:hypothetical protein [Terriglobales bacterium]